MRRASAPGDMWFEGDPAVLPHSSSLSTRSPGKPAKRVLITSRKPWFSGQPQEAPILGSDVHTAAVGNAGKKAKRKPRVRRKKAPIQPKFHFTLAEEFEMLVADDQEIMHNVLREVAIDEKFTRLVADLPANICQAKRWIFSMLTTYCRLNCSLLFPNQQKDCNARKLPQRTFS